MWNRMRTWFKASRPQPARRIGASVIAPRIPAAGWWRDDHVEQLRNYQSWVYAAVNAIAQEVARQRPFLYGNTGQAEHEQTPLPHTHPLARLLDHPNPWLTPWELWYLTVVYLELTGNCFWYVGPATANGWHAGRAVDHPDAVGARRPRPGAVRARRTRSPSPGVPTEVFAPDEIIHLKYPNPLDPHYGLSPLQANALTVDANTELQKSRYQTFLAGQRPGVVLQTEQTLTEPTVRRLEEKLQARFGGRENWHRPLVLEQGLKASPWTLTPAEMDFLNSSQMTPRRDLRPVPRAAADRRGGREHGPRRGHLVRRPGDVLRRDGPAEARPDRPGADARPRPAVRAGRGDRVPRLLAAEPGPAPRGRRARRADWACGRSTRSAAAAGCEPYRRPAVRSADAAGANCDER